MCFTLELSILKKVNMGNKKLFLHVLLTDTAVKQRNAQRKQRCSQLHAIKVNYVW